MSEYMKKRDVALAIKNEKVFAETAMRVVPAKDGAERYIPVPVPIAVGDKTSIPGKIPFSELDADTDHPNPSRLIGMKVLFVVIGEDAESDCLICSRKRAQQIAKVNMLSDLASSKVMEGSIIGFTDFGCFVDVDGVVGLLRNADYSTDHSRVNERYKIGDRMSVKCKAVSSDERHRVTWETPTKYHRTTPYICDVERDAIVLGRVIDIRNFPQSQGVFVRLEDNQELDVLCSMPAELEIEKGTQVVIRISSVEPGATEFARPRIRGKILRLA